MAECVKRLIESPPKTQRDAIPLFSYFAGRSAEISTRDTARLGESKIIPVAKRPQELLTTEKQLGKTDIKLIAPKMCFIGDSPTYRDIFDFVDFGRLPNTFLLACGSKHEPSTLQVASMLATEPARVLGIVSSPERYLTLLRTLADSLPTLKSDSRLFKQMKLSPFLLAAQYIPSNSGKSNGVDHDIPDPEDEEEDSAIMQYSLQSANKIVVADDYSTYRLFKQALLCAPQEEKLEIFYLALGSSAVSSLVENDVRLGSEVDDRGISAKLQKRIVERSRLFLHDYTGNEIKHNSKWLETKLSVRMVNGITLRRSLRGYALYHTAKQTATLRQEQRLGWVLWITSKYDMYHISQALSIQLLTRPTNQSTMLLEFLLTSDLKDLKRRGYNVDRILRAQAVDARIAEDSRRKQLEEEQRQIKEEEEQWRQNAIRQDASASQENKRSSDTLDMPGAFGSDSPGRAPTPEQKKPRGLFSGLTKRLGINNAGEAQQQLQNFLGGHSGADHDEPAPPSYDDSTKGPKSATGPGGREIEKVTSPHAVHQNLLNAVQASRAHDSSTLFSPPTTNQVKEQASYCDSVPSQNITQIGDTSNHTRIFVSKDLSIPGTIFLQQNASSLNTFAILLQEISDIYALPRKAMHIFYDENGTTIAFNAKGSIFCNFRFFQQLHLWKLDHGGAEGRTEAASWWWIVVAHELAHNLVEDHSAEHSYYT
jgi:hypothetical protein